LKTTDLDWIPYDDYYFSPEFSYVRVETIDLFGLDALRLVLTAIRRPALTQSFLEDAIATAAARADKDAARPSDVAERAFYRALSPQAPRASGVLGDAGDVRSITLDDVVALHRRLMSPENVILTISSNLPLSAVRGAVSEAFPETEIVRVPAPSRDAAEPTAGETTRTVVREVGQEQSYVLVGQSVRVAPSDEPALRVATAILSERLADRLREREGLAYSIGAGYFRDAPPTVQMRAGTRPENLERMEHGMREVATDLRTHPPSKEQIDGARNREEGRRRMLRLTRIGQAFAMGMAEFRGTDPFALDADLAELRSVGPKDVTRAAERYLAFDHSILSIAR
jgi:zinc protease